MEGVNILIRYIIILMLLMFIKGWATAISTALRVLDLKKAKYISETDKDTEKKLTSALEKIEKYTNAASVVTAVTGILTGVVLAMYFFVLAHSILFTNYDFLEPLLIILVFIYLYTFVSIVLPKFLSDRFADKLVLKTLWCLKLFSVLLFPVVCMVNVSYIIIDSLSIRHISPFLINHYVKEEIPFSNIASLLHNTALYTVQPENHVSYSNKKLWPKIQQRTFNRGVNATKAYFEYVFSKLPKKI